MEIVVTDKAMAWFQEEMEVETGDFIRFYARYGGSSPFHEGFSLGMNREHPHDIGVEAEINGIHFYIENADQWFFNEHDLHVDVNHVLEELSYTYQEK